MTSRISPEQMEEYKRTARVRQQAEKAKIETRRQSAWSELSLPWQAALEEAWSAYCAGSIPIGAGRGLHADGRILSRGRNHIHDPGEPPCISNHTLAHAEMNALLRLASRHPDRRSWALYTTTEPCPMCMGAFYMFGLGELRYASRDPWAGSANLVGATLYFSRKQVKVLGPQRLDLEIALMSLFVEFVMRRDEANIPWKLFDAWKEAAPEACLPALQTGEALCQSGETRKMGEAGVSASEAFEWLMGYQGV